MNFLLLATCNDDDERMEGVGGENGPYVTDSMFLFVLSCFYKTN